MSASQSNPFVEYLSRYTTISPEHEAAFDEYLNNADPPSGTRIRFETQTEKYLRTLFASEQPPSVILTGNAGDGKTYLCRMIIESLTGSSFGGWNGNTELEVNGNEFSLRVIKDLSEINEQAGGDILRCLDRAFVQSNSKEVFLVAANEGRLRAVLQRANLPALYKEVDRQLSHGPDLGNSRLLVLNLNNVATSSFVQQATAWMTDSDHWEACASCLAKAKCSIHFNAAKLREPRLTGRIRLLYEILEHLGIHVTIRDMLIHLAFVVTGGLKCDKVIESSIDLNWEPHNYVYYKNIWGDNIGPAIRRRMLVFNYLRRLDPGKTSTFEIDNLIVNGAFDTNSEAEMHAAILSEGLDTGWSRFQQDRKQYLHGDKQPSRDGNHSPFVEWLPHIRRKLFFEWDSDNQAFSLLPFSTLSVYLRLLKGDTGLLEQYKRELVLGLNRAFTGLYLNQADNLYVTSLYANSAEQPIPIVRIALPALWMELGPEKADSKVFDMSASRLALKIPLPPNPLSQAPTVHFRLDLLRFEYIIRRAQGGTPDILASECELSIQQLRDEILSSYITAGYETDQSDTKPSNLKRLKFFVLVQNSYQLRSLWIDEQGNICSQG